MSPPPGWYHDPSAPHLERWWDGTAWTDHWRGAAPEGTPPPEPPGPGAAGPSGGESPRAKAIAMTVAGAVLVAAVVTGALVLSDGDGDDGTGDPGRDTRVRPVPAPTAATPTPTPFATPTGDPDVVVDHLNGLTFPVLPGWEPSDSSLPENSVLRTDATYDCPGEGSLCRHGWVVSRTVTENDETSPKALAEADIEAAADAAYDRDELDRLPYGGIESHTEIAAGPVAVAGRAGYYVRWRVETALGPGGYVQSLAFPAGTGTQAPVVVRYAVDAGEDAPPLADLDRITRGIRPLGDPATGGGVGSGVTPSG
ncbi:DUF2510 domain-containing protein [Streptomyces sp. NPDC004610]|uniref:DUF2510 domain-containing protein n=1 Tax=unclassified Streptomyces TaxID=2593676 RepID=UPI0033A25CE6